ncbi:hypothetical protein EDD11_008935 [Mortierella claussenii]|nr:hypothetical protein EDD11_008935 [Mortierella claussenii]
MAAPGISPQFENSDPVLRSIARELVLNLDQTRTPTTHVDSSFRSTPRQEHEISLNQSPAQNLVPAHDLDQDRLHPYEFRLQSFCTRPAICKKLFPLHVQKKRYQKITVQERLILVSVQLHSKQDLVQQAQGLDRNQDQDNDGEDREQRSMRHEEELDQNGYVLVAGLEVLEYLLVPLHHDQQHPVERIIYIAKVDTSGCWPLPGLDTRERIKSPAYALVQGYLKAMRTFTSSSATSQSRAVAEPTSSASVGASAATTIADISSLAIVSSAADTDLAPKSTMSRTSITTTVPAKTSLYIFARAQPQYLFAESAYNPGKRVLDDRGLVRWWKNIVTSVYGPSSAPSADPVDGSSSKQDIGNGVRRKKSRVKAWWHIPGIETERQALNIIQSTSRPLSVSSSSPFSWTYGHPDKGSTEMAHTLIPQFPDDPKSRIMQSPSCSGGFVDVNTFWELAAIGEESGAGKITGFFRVTYEDDEDGKGLEAKIDGDMVVQFAESSTAELIASTVTKAIMPIQHQQGSRDAYTKVINYLLKLDFSTFDKAKQSTVQWFARVDIWRRKIQEKHEREQQQQQQQQQQPQQPQEPQEDGVSSPSSISSLPSPWIQSLKCTVCLRHAMNKANASEEQQQQSVHMLTITTTSAAGSQAPVTPAVALTLNPGLIKRKVSDSTALSSVTPPAVNVLSSNLIKRKASQAAAVATSCSNAGSSGTAPVINILSANHIKKRPDTTASETVAPGPQPSPSSVPAVNILGAKFIKKRKI